MNDNELAAFINKYVQPNAVDIETTRRKVLERLSAEASWRMVQSDELIAHISRAMAPDPFPTPEGYISLTPDLNEVKAKIAVREALQTLHSAGAIVALGPPVATPGTEQQSFSFARPHTATGLSGTSVYFPVVHHGYRLATMFQGAKFRLAAGDAYLSHLDRSALTSRATRCLDECVNAFRHGLYLSAAMNAGAASENLWMELGNVTYTKTGHTKSLEAELKRPYPSIGIVIDQAWQALTSHADAELRSVFATSSERSIFKDFADRLRDRRNYAIHSEDAGVDEPLFMYNETGMLLLDASDYFNKLLRLIAAMQARP